MYISGHFTRTSSRINAHMKVVNLLFPINLYCVDTAALGMHPRKLKPIHHQFIFQYSLATKRMQMPKYVVMSVLLTDVRRVIGENMILKGT